MHDGIIGKMLKRQLPILDEDLPNNKAVNSWIGREVTGNSISAGLLDVIAGSFPVSSVTASSGPTNAPETACAET